jgi:hypothetical protein
MAKYPHLLILQNNKRPFYLTVFEKINRNTPLIHLRCYMCIEGLSDLIR